MILRPYLDNLWRWSVGIKEADLKKCGRSIMYLRHSEWSPLFEKLMRNRLVMGALRYGLLNAKNKTKYDRVPSMYQRLDLYAKTGNLECLVDVANLALLEFEEGEHPKKHLKSADDGIHTVEAIA